MPKPKGHKKGCACPICKRVRKHDAKKSASPATKTKRAAKKSGAKKSAKKSAQHHSGGHATKAEIRRAYIRGVLDGHKRRKRA